jgi:FkbM family methyltransferase
MCLLFAGVWEGGLNNLFSSLAAQHQSTEKNSMVVVDVGANVGAFSLYVASQGYTVHSFEMQATVFRLLEMSRRVNNYHKMHLHHAALWNTSGQDVSYTPVVGNYGGTSLLGGGNISMKTSRFDDILQLEHVFFMKIDGM